MPPGSIPHRRSVTKRNRTCTTSPTKTKKRRTRARNPMPRRSRDRRAVAGTCRRLRSDSPATFAGTCAFPSRQPLPSIEAPKNEASGDDFRLGSTPGPSFRKPQSPGREPLSRARPARCFGEDARESTFGRGRIETAASSPSPCATGASWIRTPRHAREHTIGWASCCSRPGSSASSRTGNSSTILASIPACSPTRSRSLSFSTGNSASMPSVTERPPTGR